MPNNTKMSTTERDAEIIDRLGKMPANELTQSQKAQLAAARVRVREATNPPAKPKAPKQGAPMVKMTETETPEDVQREKNMRKGEEAAKKQMGTLAFKKGGLVTPRGQGKVMRTRKARMY